MGVGEGAQAIWQRFRRWPTWVQALIAVVVLGGAASAFALLGDQSARKAATNEPTAPATTRATASPAPRPTTPPPVESPEEMIDDFQDDALDREDTPEYKLAVIDTGGYVNPADPLVDRFAQVLDSLERKCEDDDREFLGDMAVRSQQLMQDEGVQERILSILTNVDKSIPKKSGKMGSCSDIFATYVALRVG